MELSIAAVAEKITVNGLYWEPKDGKVSEVLSSDKDDGPHRVLDIGEHRTRTASLLSQEQTFTADLHLPALFAGSGVTASWVTSMADRFPKVECIGVDLVPSDLT